MLLLGAIMSCLVLLASGSSWAFTEWASGKLNRSDVFGGLLDGERPDSGPTGALTFLVIGSDHREDDAEGDRRSDSMMLVHVNNDRDHVNVVGLPRDSWVDVPGHGKNKINAAYAYGGPQLAIQTVESASNVRIDHYVEVDFTGFTDVVDAVGGINVCLPEPIHDPKAHLAMDAGTHQVDGQEALAFSRTRQTSGGDLDRIDRQQQVISALLESALSSETLSDPTKLSSFLDTALSAVTVDEGLDTETINQLGGQVGDLSLDDVSFAQAPVAEADYTTPTGEVAVRWDEDAANDLFADINADRAISDDGDDEGGASDENAGGDDADLHPEDVQVDVYNGTGEAGLGDQVRGAFADAGFAASGTAQNWTTNDVTTTLVRHAPADEDAARLVSESVPGSELHRDSTLSGQVQVVIGSDYTTVSPPESSEPSPSASEGGQLDEVSASTAQDNVCD